MVSIYMPADPVLNRIQAAKDQPLADGGSDGGIYLYA
jgi:hypothetical protein